MKEKSLVLIHILVLFPLLLWVHIALLEYATDDAYIHFRIVSNLLEHGVPYYNLDSAVMASSSSLWTLVLGLMFTIFGKTLWIVACLNALLITGTSLAFCRLFSSLDSQNADSGDVLFRGSQCVAVMLVCVSTLLTSSIQLMETPLACWLVAEAVLAYSKRRSISFVFLSLAVFVRLEFVVFLGVFCLHSFFKKHIPIWKTILLILAVGLPFVGYALFFFGTVIPHTIIAKSQIYSLEVQHTLTLALFGYFGKFLSHDWTVFLVAHIGFVAIFSMLRMKELTSYLLSKSHQLHVTVFLCGGIILLAYIANHVFLFPWYLPLYTFPLLIGLYGMVRSSPGFALKIWFWILLSPVLFVGGRNLYAGILGSPLYFEDFEGGAKVRRYIEVARDLNEKYPEEVLMTSEIGGIGYGFKGTVLDAAGLATPEALRFHNSVEGTSKTGPMTGGIPKAFVLEKEPGLIVGLDYHVSEIVNSSVAQKYQRFQIPVLLLDDAVRTNLNTILRSKHVNVFVRKGLSPKEVKNNAS